MAAKSSVLLFFFVINEETSMFTSERTKETDGIKKQLATNRCQGKTKLHKLEKTEMFLGEHDKGVETTARAHGPQRMVAYYVDREASKRIRS